VTFEPRHWMSLADTEIGRKRGLDVGVSGVSGRYGDLAADVRGLRSSLSAELNRSLTTLTHKTLNKLEVCRGRVVLNINISPNTL